MPRFEDEEDDEDEYNYSVVVLANSIGVAQSHAA